MANRYAQAYEWYRRGILTKEQYVEVVDGLSKLIDTETMPDWFHVGQAKAWHDDATDVVIVAGTQGGKTAFEPHWLLREIQRCSPGIRKLGFGRFIYAGPTLTLLEEQAIPSFEELFAETHQLGKLIRGNKSKFHFSKDGLRRLIGFDDCPVTVSFAYTKDSSNLESMTALAGVWDEAGQKENKLASYRAYNRRLKAARTMGFGRRCFGTTPYEWNWFKTYVVDPAERKQAGFGLHRFVSWMNPLVSEEECRKDLDNGMPLWEWQMMYLGEFTQPAGLIYDCFDAKKMVVPRFKIPDEWPRYVGLDFGLRNTAAVFIAEELAPGNEPGTWGSPTGRLIRYREYKPGRNLPVEAHVREILKGEPRLPICVGGSHTEEDVRAGYRLAGLPVREPLVSEVEARILCVYGEHAANNGDNTMVFDDLPMYLDEKSTYSRELDDSMQPTEKIKDKASYHLMDAEGYVMTLLRPTRGGWGKLPSTIEKLKERNLKKANG